MKTLTAISTAALLALAVPAFAQNSPANSGAGTNSSQPNGSPNAAGGTDPKNGGAAGMTEGRSSATDSNGMTNNMGATKNGGGSTNGATNNNMAPGGGPGEVSK